MPPAPDRSELGRSSPGRHLDEVAEFEAELRALKAKGKGALKFKRRCELAGRRADYDGLYAYFCVDAHNNSAALAERALSETADGSPLVSFFGEYDQDAVARRLNIGLSFALDAAEMIHGALQTPAPAFAALRAELVQAQRMQREQRLP